MHYFIVAKRKKEKHPYFAIIIKIFVYLHCEYGT
nr:MAG TPA: hypothetical protein [Caudoviricetes sp.]